MDISQDELRRRLRQVDRDQKSVDRRWRGALNQVFDEDSGLTPDEKAGVLGVPARRQFFKLGGVGIAGALLFAACSDDDDAGVATSGDAGTDGPAGGGNSMDLALARTAASLEALAVTTYDAAIKSNLVTTPVVGQAAMVFMDHHQQHQDALNGVIESAGGQAVNEPNAAVKAAVVDPVLTGPGLDEAKIVKLAYELEDAAAQTYVFAVGALSTKELRSTLATIAGIEAQHRSIIMMVAKLPPAEIFPAAFYKSENPLPDAALLTG